MLSGKRVFVSGGAGVIGTALVDMLLEQGACVIVGDLKPMPKAWEGKVIYRQGDLNYIRKEELDYYAPDLFFHLAATFERSVETYEFWDENFQHNVRLSHHLMTLLKDSVSLQKVVFASSYLIYNPKLYNFDKPADKATSLQEDNEIQPRNLCGVAKLMHEMELDFLNHFNGGRFQTVCARIFRSYGRNSRDIVSRWIRMLLQGEAIHVYKKEGIFDYIYADDVAQGLIRLADSSMTGVINLGTGQARRVADVVEVLGGYFPEMRITEGDLDIPYEASEANMDKFRDKLGWVPEHRLEDAIPKMIRFEQNRMLDEYPEGEASGVNALVTSISKKVPMLNAVRQALLKLGNGGKLYGGDVNDSCIGRHFVDEFWHMPRLQDLKVEQLIEYCHMNGISVIIPSRDGELAYFAELKEHLLEHGIQVMVSSPAAIEATVDKLKFYNFLNKNGFPVIPTVEGIKELKADHYVIKERFGAGSEHIRLRLGLEEAQAHGATLKHPIFQPYVAGREYSVDLFMDAAGHAKGSIARTRDVIVAGESQVTTTVTFPKLEQMCAEAAETLGLTGHAVMQVLVDDHGGFHLIECNSRFGGASRLSVEAGLDSFFWFLLESIGADLKDVPFLRKQHELELVRYAEDRIICR
jgi:carbamoyl-phosphate synthase large subunit